MDSGLNSMVGAGGRWQVGVGLRACLPALGASGGTPVREGCSRGAALPPPSALHVRHRHPPTHWLAGWVQVMANNNEMILLPVNEPTHGTKR